MLVWGQDLIRRFSRYYYPWVPYLSYLFWGGLRACVAAMSIFCLVAVSAVLSPNHGPGDSADVWISFRNRSSDGPNLVSLGARVGSTLEAQDPGGALRENILSPSLYHDHPLYDCAEFEGRGWRAVVRDPPRRRRRRGSVSLRQDGAWPSLCSCGAAA